jgi:hypothetical protein
MVCVCLSVCRKKFFLSVQVRHRYQLYILRLLTKRQGFDFMVLKYMYIKLDNTNFRHVEPTSQLIYISHLTVYLRAKKQT